jgi:hypothetical protein
MSCPHSSAKHGVVPIQVWVHLASDCQMRVIRLMAQLACKLVAEGSADREAEHAVTTRHAENPA